MIATREAYGNAVTELGKINDKVVVLDADLAKATKTEIFKKAFPERFFDIGIAEQDMIAIKATMRIGYLVVKDDAFAAVAANTNF